MPKSRFIRQADRICVRQVPYFKQIEVLVIKWQRAFDEAVAADDLDTALVALKKYGNQPIRIANLLDKRKRKIKRLMPVRGKSPAYYVKTLNGLARANRKLGKAAHALAANPTQENVDRFEATNRPLEKAAGKYFKSARSYGFRKCSKPLAVR